MMPKQWKAKVRQAEEKGKHSRWRERHRQRRSKNENVSMKPEQPRGRRVQREVGSRPDGDVEPQAGQFHAAGAGGGAR